MEREDEDFTGARLINTICNALKIVIETYTNSNL